MLRQKQEQLQEAKSSGNQRATTELQRDVNYINSALKERKQAAEE